jgi:type I restriction enzyme S subunit
LSDLDALAQSIFYDMFGDPIENEKGWEVKKLDSIYKVTSSKRVFQEEWKTEGIPFYKVADIVSLINDEKVIPNTFITEAKYNELKLQSLVPNTGDILVTSRGTLGQCYIVKADDQFYFQDGMITWLSAKKVGISPIYIKMLFKTESFLNSLLQKANISTVAYLSINQLANRFIPIPPLPLQQEFAKRIELIEQQKAQIGSTIKDLETLLASRMQHWFD